MQYLSNRWLNPCLVLGVEILPKGPHTSDIFLLTNGINLILFWTSCTGLHHTMKSWQQSYSGERKSPEERLSPTEPYSFWETKANTVSSLTPKFQVRCVVRHQMSLFLGFLVVENSVDQLGHLRQRYLLLLFTAHPKMVVHIELESVILYPLENFI